MVITCEPQIGTEEDGGNSAWGIVHRLRRLLHSAAGQVRSRAAGSLSSEGRLLSKVTAEKKD